MRLGTRAAAFGILAATAGFALDAPTAEARPPLVVKKFLLGWLEGGTYNFVATGARGTTNAFRDNIIMIVFSNPVDFDSLSDRTVQIGIPQGGGFSIPAEGSFYRYVVYERDDSAPSGDVYIPKRHYRNRFVFDPMGGYAHWSQPYPTHYDGFLANTTYTVAVPGIDGGAPRTVEDAAGRPLEATFTTTFTTTDDYLWEHGW